MLEAAPLWTPELQRRLRSGDVAVKGCRSVADLFESGSLAAAVLAWDGVDPEVPQAVHRLRGWAPDMAIVAVVPRRHIETEWCLLDLGATIVLEDSCGGVRLVKVVRRALTPLSQKRTVSTVSFNSIEPAG